jgi:hypothetical protein
MSTSENKTPGKEQSTVPPPSPGNGPQGVDKAPGEETAQSTSDLTMESLKGKKVDADPSLPPGQPAPENG